MNQKFSLQYHIVYLKKNYRGHNLGPGRVWYTVAGGPVAII